MATTKKNRKTVVLTWPDISASSKTSLLLVQCFINSLAFQITLFSEAPISICFAWTLILSSASKFCPGSRLMIDCQMQISTGKIQIFLYRLMKMYRATVHTVAWVASVQLTVVGAVVYCEFLLTTSFLILYLEQRFNYVLLFEHECNLVLKSVRTEFTNYTGFCLVELFQKPVIPTSFFLDTNGIPFYKQSWNLQYNTY